jgi:hypothetical protein
MSPEIIALIVVAVVALVVVGIAVFKRPQLKGQGLRRRFGPEYDRAVQDRGSREEAERELLARERRHQELDIRPLEPDTRERYRTEWLAVQERFVDDPRGAAGEADRLITSIMTEQGYPDEGYEQRLADLSVEYSRTVDHYRQAHDIGARSAGDGASTEDLRQALVHYRAIFDELLGEKKAAKKTERREVPADAAEESTGRKR